MGGAPPGRLGFVLGFVMEGAVVGGTPLGMLGFVLGFILRAHAAAKTVTRSRDAHTSWRRGAGGGGGGGGGGRGTDGSECGCGDGGGRRTTGRPHEREAHRCQFGSIAEVAASSFEDLGPVEIARGRVEIAPNAIASIST